MYYLHTVSSLGLGLWLKGWAASYELASDPKLLLSSCAPFDWLILRKWLLGYFLIYVFILNCCMGLSWAFAKLWCLILISFSLQFCGISNTLTSLPFFLQKGWSAVGDWIKVCACLSPPYSTRAPSPLQAALPEPLLCLQEGSWNCELLLCEGNFLPPPCSEVPLRGELMWFC